MREWRITLIKDKVELRLYVNGNEMDSYRRNYSYITEAFEFIKRFEIEYELALNS